MEHHNRTNSSGSFSAIHVDDSEPEVPVPSPHAFASGPTTSMHIEDPNSSRYQSSSHISMLRSCLHHAIENIKSQWQLLLFGQVLSLLIAGTGAAQSTLALECHLSAPSFALGCVYFGLSFSLIPLVREQKQMKQLQQSVDAAFCTESDLQAPVVADSNRSSSITSTSSSAMMSPPAPYSFFGVPLQSPAWGYFWMAVLDVYSQYFTVLAFKYTTITSVELFDALAIPSAMVLSRCVLSRQYTSLHLLGVSACMVGVMFNVWQDYHDDSDSDSTINQDYPHKTFGDILSITGGLLIGASNVVGEVAVRNFGGPNEYLGMMGVFGTLICAIQALVFEKSDIAAFFGRDDSETCHVQNGWFLLIGFVLSAVMSYNGVSRFLQISEAAFLNLSLLTGDLWSVIFSIFAERIVPKPMFFFALIFILSGVFVYEMAPTPVAEDHDKREPSVSSPWRRIESGESTHMDEEVSTSGSVDTSGLRKRSSDYNGHNSSLTELELI